MKTSVLRSMNHQELENLHDNLRHDLKFERNPKFQLELQTHIAWVQKVMQEQRDERSARRG